MTAEGRTQAEARDRLRLARMAGIGPITYRRLIGRFETAAAALAALPGLARSGAKLAIPTEASALRELEAVARLGGRFLFLDAPDYPPFLALLDDAPAAIAVLGDPACLAGRAVAVVGARNASANGQRMAELLAADLARAGLVVVSGLARGIDAAAHEGAMTAGRTVAVVAGGLDQPYPPEHAALQARIAQAGAVVAESPLGTAPLARHFPRRNRIIAGLSLGVVVVEAALRSGTLTTARLAQEAGRDIFAVPGSPLDPRARGANDLIRAGAVLTESAADVLANLTDHPLRQGIGRDPLFARADAGLAEPEGAFHPGFEPPSDPSQARAEVIALLGADPVSVDDLLRRCQLSASAVMAVLLDLELVGLVEPLPGNRFALISDPGR